LSEEQDENVYDSIHINSESVSNETYESDLHDEKQDGQRI
jgi:hypothetical protein